MSKQTGFLQLRRGLWDHLRDGRMTPFETLAFIYICSQADTRTGVWKGSAGALVGELGFESRTARDVLERMERDGYIRRFTVPGSHVCYPILVHKFLLTTAEHHGEQLDALSSTFENGCLKLAFFPREEHGEVNGKDNGEGNASQKRMEKRKKRKETHKRGDAAKAAAAPSALYVEKLKTLSDQTTNTLVLRMLGKDNLAPTVFDDIHRRFKKHADDLGIEFEDACNVYREAMRAAEYSMTAPLGPFVIDPIGPVDEARLIELATADPLCLNAYMVGDIAIMEYEHGFEEIHPNEGEPFWFAYDEPAEENSVNGPALEHALSAVTDSTEPSARIANDAHQ